jgi:hypothetical protein
MDLNDSQCVGMLMRHVCAGSRVKDFSYLMHSGEKIFLRRAKIISLKLAPYIAGYWMPDYLKIEQAQPRR